MSGNLTVALQSIAVGPIARNLNGNVFFGFFVRKTSLFNHLHEVFELTHCGLIHHEIDIFDPQCFQQKQQRDQSWRDRHPFGQGTHFLLPAQHHEADGLSLPGQGHPDRQDPFREPSRRGKG